MPEETKKRTVDEISQEYQNLCLKAGHTQYQINVLNNELNLINSTLRDLNLEAASLKASEPKKEETK